jgi:hypothetical protein
MFPSVVPPSAPAPDTGIDHDTVRTDLSGEGELRETATRVLGEVADRGLIRLAGGRITVLDAPRPAYTPRARQSTKRADTDAGSHSGL